MRSRKEGITVEKPKTDLVLLENRRFTPIFYQDNVVEWVWELLYKESNFKYFCYL
jgi:hypothetical protein